jgi:hypothetical protein
MVPYRYRYRYRYRDSRSSLVRTDLPHNDTTNNLCTATTAGRLTFADTRRPSSRTNC